MDFCSILEIASGASASQGDVRFQKGTQEGISCDSGLSSSVDVDVFC